MLPIFISSSRFDRSSVELLPPTLLITSSSFYQLLFQDLLFRPRFFFFLFAFTCFFPLQFLQYRLLGNKKLHHCTVTNRKSCCRANMNRSHRLYICVRVYIYCVFIYTASLSRRHFTFLVSDWGKDFVFQYQESKIPWGWGCTYSNIFGFSILARCMES